MTTLVLHIVEALMSTVLIDLRELFSINIGYGAISNCAMTLNVRKIIIIYILSCLEAKLVILIYQKSMQL